MTLASACLKSEFLSVYLFAISLLQCADSRLALLLFLRRSTRPLHRLSPCHFLSVSHLTYAGIALSLCSAVSLQCRGLFLRGKTPLHFCCSNCVGDVLVLETRLCVRELSADSHTAQICYERDLPSVWEKKQCQYSQHHVCAGAQARPVICSPHRLEIVTFSLSCRLELQCFLLSIHRPQRFAPFGDFGCFLQCVGLVFSF